MPTLNRRYQPKPKKQGANFRWVYQSYRWHRFSAAFLKRNPLCAECKQKGILERSEVTDHVIPLVIWVLEMGRDPYDIVNLQPLSKRCHNRKTRNERHSGNQT